MFVSAAHLKFRKVATAAVLLASFGVNFVILPIMCVLSPNEDPELYNCTVWLYMCALHRIHQSLILYTVHSIDVWLLHQWYTMYFWTGIELCMHVFVYRVYICIHTLHHMCTCINIYDLYIYINTSYTPYILLRPFIAYICAVATCSAPHLQEGEANGHAPSGDCMFSKVHSLHVHVVKSS